MSSLADQFGLEVIEERQKTKDFGIQIVKPKKNVKEEKIPKKSEQLTGRFIKGLVSSPGLVGDVLSLTGLEQQEHLPGQAARMLLEARATPEELIALAGDDDIIPSFAPIPTTKQTKKFTEELGLPKGDPETFLEKTAEYSGEFLGGNLFTGGLGKGATAFKTVIKPFVSSFVPGAALAGAEISDLPPWGQALSVLGGSLLAHRMTGKSLRQLNSEKYSQAFFLLPEDATTSAKNLSAKTASLKKELLKGGKAPSERAVLSAVEEIESKVVDGKIPIDNLTALKRSFNEFILADEVRKQPRARKLLKSLNQEIDNAIESYGKKQNPEFLEIYREANSAHKGLAENQIIGKFIKKINPYVKTHAVLNLINIPLAIGGLAAFPASKSAELLVSLARNKGLRHLYSNVLKNAATENKAATIRSIEKFNEELRKVDSDLYNDLRK